MLAVWAHRDLVCGTGECGGGEEVLWARLVHHRDINSAYAAEPVLLLGQLTGGLMAGRGGRFCEPECGDMVVPDLEEFLVVCGFYGCS